MKNLAIKTKNKGQAIVELALVLPLFIFMILGIFDFGRALHAWSNLNYQCTRAARLASRRINPLIARNVFSSSTHTPLQEVEEVFWHFRSPLMPQDSYTSVVFSGVESNDTNIEVRASYAMTLYTPMVGQMIGSANRDGNLVLSAVARERKE